MSILLPLVLYWALVGVILWVEYGIGIQVQDGNYTRPEALAMVAKMALIVSILTAIVWFLADRRKKKEQGWKLSWAASWKTVVVLILYAFIVLLRRSLWTTTQGINDNAMFLPVVGHTNAQFFSEFNWLSFVVEVIPTLGCVSGLLYLLRTLLLRWFRSGSIADGGERLTDTAG